MGDDLRDDIQAAKDRMRVKFGGRRELKRLEQHLWPNERVNEITTGTYGGGQGLIVLTTLRLLFFREGWVGKNSEDFPIDKVSSVGFKSGMLTGTVTVFASGNKAEITGVYKQDGKRIVDNMRARLMDRGEDPDTDATEAGVPSGKDDPMEKLRKLGELRDAGIVTDEEFVSKKKQLLDSL